ncbi:hypothetical protein BSKO_00637 [Bryopsis sp. KO-2023]|nr:hypothetical protein BSKO_00637 [Bryopsis sp. KO-2023]
MNLSLPFPHRAPVTTRKSNSAGTIDLRFACSSEKQFLFVDRSRTAVPYETAWHWQKQTVDLLCSAPDGVEHPDCVFLVQHPPVFTLGAGSSESNLKFDADDPPHPLYRTERGGEVTYHGPGQLVLYPIINLKRHKCDLHWYMRQLEEVAIQSVMEVSGLQGERIAGLTGVWVEGSKVAAIGVRAKRWVTYHGLALNVAMDLSPFSMIVPCGISNRAVTSVKDSLAVGSENAAREMDDQELLEEYRFGLLDSFEQVFDREGVPVTVEELGLAGE